MFVIKSIFAAVVLAVQALAVPAASSSLVVIEKRETPFGTLVLYGDAPGSTPSVNATLAARSPCRDSLAVTCNGGLVPDQETCQTLINEFIVNSQTMISSSPKSICLIMNGNQCCSTWTNTITNLTQGELLPAASVLFNTCVAHAQSGIAFNANLGGICTIQCLSNHAVGC